MALMNAMPNLEIASLAFREIQKLSSTGFHRVNKILYCFSLSNYTNTRASERYKELGRAKARNSKFHVIWQRKDCFAMRKMGVCPLVPQLSLCCLLLRAMQYFWQAAAEKYQLKTTDFLGNRQFRTGHYNVHFSQQVSNAVHQSHSIFDEICQRIFLQTMEV
ncbi:hypothetical protein NIES4074_30020 [Cylindrospermum sp. NIES-4074]|nr:hypothetical protein NIES4074_30020 [Cylindrospermum sp. NIES-4074]